MLLIVALQNVVTYSVNMIDNIMLGLSARSSVRSSHCKPGFLHGGSVCPVHRKYSGGDYIPVLGARKKLQPIPYADRWLLLKAGYYCQFRDHCHLRLLSGTGPAYFHKFSGNHCRRKGLPADCYVDLCLFIISNILMAALRAVGTVNIAFYTSIVSLGINAFGNYVLIYGKLGFPQLGLSAVLPSVPWSHVL